MTGSSDPRHDPGVAAGVRREEVIKGTIWRCHLAGHAPEAIAAEIMRKWGDRGVSCDAASVAAWIARQSARRGPAAPTRLQRLSQLESGLEILRGELATALANFESDTHDHGRVGAFIALLAACEFIEGFADVAKGTLSKPLRALAMALHELEEGIVHPMLEKTVVRHRPKAGQATDSLVTFAALALEAAVQDKTPLNTAARQVATALHARGYRQPNGKPITAATVKNWRARASEGPGGAYDGAARRLAMVRDLATSKDLTRRPGFLPLLDALDGWARLSGLPRETGNRRKPRS